MQQDNTPVTATDPNAPVVAPVATPAPVVETPVTVAPVATPAPTVGQVIAPEEPVVDAPVVETPVTPVV